MFYQGGCKDFPAFNNNTFIIIIIIICNNISDSSFV